MIDKMKNMIMKKIKAIIEKQMMEEYLYILRMLTGLMALDLLSKKQRMIFYLS